MPKQQRSLKTVCYQRYQKLAIRNYKITIKITKLNCKCEAQNYYIKKEKLHSNMLC